MSDELFGFAAPPFKPQEALQRLRRDLRALGLSEREGAFERRGLLMARASASESELDAAIAKLPGRSPEWQQRTLKSSADIRDFVAELKKRMAVWSERDE